MSYSGNFADHITFLLNENEVVDHLGADDFQMVIDEYQNKSLAEIESSLDEMFTQDNNHKLAASIRYHVNRQ